MTRVLPNHLRSGWILVLGSSLDWNSCTHRQPYHNPTRSVLGCQRCFTPEQNRSYLVEDFAFLVPGRGLAVHLEAPDLQQASGTKVTVAIRWAACQAVGGHAATSCTAPWKHPSGPSLLCWAALHLWSARVTACLLPLCAPCPCWTYCCCQPPSLSCST